MNTYDLDLNTLVRHLATHKVLTYVKNEQLTVLSNPANTDVQSLIDRFYYNMPDLLPTQFHFMLNKYGFDLVINQLLPVLRDDDIDKYAMYKAYLEQARFYEFAKTLVMFNDIKTKFIAFDESFDLTVEQLKAMWMEARHRK